MDGITEAVKVLLCCTVWFAVCGCSEHSIAATTEKNEPVKRSFEDLYEPSAAVAVEGRGVLLFEDDGSEMVSLQQIVEDDSGVLLKKQYSGSVQIDVTDIEGAAKGVKNTVFVVTSHSLDKHEQRSARREQLFQLKVSHKMEIDLLGSGGLWEGIVDELLKIDHSLGDRKNQINIEGLSFSVAGDNLMIGLRSPLYKGKAIVLLLENPYDIISETFTPKFAAQPLFFDLGGAGLRAMTFHNDSEQYYFVSEVKTKKEKMRPRLWAWDGKRQHRPVRMDFPGLKSLKNIEGLTFFSYENKDMALFVCDDGNKKKKDGAHYAIVEVSQLQKHDTQ